MRIRSSFVLVGIAAACSGKGDPARPTQAGAAGATPVAVAMEQAKVASVPLPIYQSSQQIAGDQIQAPWTLTASDGSGLLATRVVAKAVVQGPLAFTELHLYFHNTEARVREGTFAITLPPGASVSRFAMESNGQFMEAELVEKQLARRAYEDNLHRRQDPALLEKAPGNQFTARVFPIPAKADKHLVISFSQELPGARYALPLRGLPKIEAIDVVASVTGADGRTTKQTLSQRNWTPDRDFVSDAPAAVEALGAGTYVVAQLAPFDQAQAAADRPTGMTVLVDTSASRALGFERYARGVRELIAQIAERYGAAMPVEIVAFDQDTQPIYAGPASGVGDAQVRALLARGAAGASDLGQALASLKQPKGRVVVITDGVITAGAEAAGVKSAVGALAGKKVDRLDVVLAGGIRDDAFATQLVTALPRAGAVLDLDQGTADVVAGLGERVLTNVPVSVPGAAWVYPKMIASARPSTRTMVYAKMAAPAQTVQVTIGDRTRAVGVAGATPALVERAVAGAEIAELEGKLDAAQGDERKQLRAQIAQKSIAARVVSSQTSMLVLESDADYARYGIDRRSLSDILVVGANGLEQQKRVAQLAIPAPVTEKPMPAKAQKAKAKDLDGLDDVTATKEVEKADKSAEDMGGKDEDQKTTGADDGDVIATAQISQGEATRAPGAPAAEPPPPPPAPTMAPPRTTAPGPRIADPSARLAVADDRPSPDRPDTGNTDAWPPPGSPEALRGPLAEIDRALRTGNVDAALAQAQAWHAKDPGDVLALVGLGNALEAKRDLPAAARMYGSLIDLFPGRADLRRFAGERLERVGAQARALTIDTYRRAVEERPDHMTGHRLLAYALLQDNQHAEAFAAILAGVDQPYPAGRFAGGDRVLAEDAGLIGAAYIAANPGARGAVMGELAKRGIALPAGASTRFILYWETDANDVDFHIQDARGGHAFYAAKQLASGGELYADITTGYGPEEFAIEGKPTAGPYHLSINYYSQGPMGYGMGLLQILHHDGAGHLTLEDRPYVIMNDHAYVDLGTFSPK